MTPNRLYRSRDRQLAGVAGGMADYLGIDPTIVRILWILGGLFSGGLLILAYIILAFVIPESPFHAPQGQGWTPAPGQPVAGWGPAAGPAANAAANAGAPAWGPAPAAPAWSPDWAARAAAEQRARERSRRRGPGAAVIIGVVLIVVGVIALADTIVPSFVGAPLFGPALVITLGGALLVGSLRRADGASTGTAPAGSAPGTATATPDASAPAAATPARDDEFAPAAIDDDATASVDLGWPIDPTGSAGTDPAPR